MITSIKAMLDHESISHVSSSLYSNLKSPGTTCPLILFLNRHLAGEKVIYSEKESDLNQRDVGLNSCSVILPAVSWASYFYFSEPHISF